MKIEVFKCELGDVRYFVENGEPFYLLTDIAKWCGQTISMFFIFRKRMKRELRKVVIEKNARYKNVGVTIINRVELKELINEMKLSKHYPQLKKGYNCLVGGAVIKNNLFDEVVEVEVVEEAPQTALSNKDENIPANGIIPKKLTYNIENYENVENSNFEIFNNSDFGSIRVLEINGEPFFVGKDIADILGYANATKAVLMHTDEEDRVKEVIEAQSQNGMVVKTETNLINESGLYSLIFGSKLPQAKKFKRWVTSEVLPSIRKHGGYLTPAKQEELVNNPDLLIELATRIKRERAEKEIEIQKRLQVEKEKQIVETKLLEAQPKIEYAEVITGSDGALDIETYAKTIIKKFKIKKDKNFGRNTLFRILREEGYLIGGKTQNKNTPYQRYIKMGWFDTIPIKVKNGNFEMIKPKTLITGKGQLELLSRITIYLDKNGYLET